MNKYLTFSSLRLRNAYQSKLLWYCTFFPVDVSLHPIHKLLMMYTVKLPPHHTFHISILVVYQYSCWELSSVAFSFLVSFCEQFEIVWRSHISITQGVNESTKGKRSMINDLTATPWHHGENPIYKTFLENSTNVSMKRLV